MIRHSLCDTEKYPKAFSHQSIMDLPDYRYEPLSPRTPAIRLLEVLSSKSDELRCQLKEVSLAQNPKFTALSYTWGTTEDRIRAICYNNGKPTYLYITPNLHSFLCQFIVNYPEPCTRPVLWVDALCINQEDDEERNTQVAMMQDIYQKAERVVVWLGEGTHQSNTGMDFVPQLIAAEQRAKTLGGDAVLPSVARHRLRKLGLPAESGDGEEDEYTGFASLFKRAWFARVWVIQEVAMAKEVQLTCGLRWVSWDDFVKAFYFMHTLNMLTPDPASYFQAIVRVLGIIDARKARLLGYDRDLLGTLLRCRSSLATDPRDKVFGLLGITTDTGPNALKCRADYQVNVQEAYTELSVAVISFEQSLDILGVPSIIGRSSVEDLPSWVPDWSTWDSTSALNRRDRPATCERDSETLLRKAAGDTKAVPQLSSNKRELGIQGYVFDEVTEVGSIHKYEDELIMDSKIWLIDITNFYRSKKRTQALLHWESISEARNGKMYPPTGETMLAAYWQTITAGWQLDDEHKLSSSAYLEWDSYHRPGASLRRLVGPSIATTSTYAWFTFGLNLCKQLVRPPPELGFDGPLNMAFNRRFIRSKKGFMGLVPAETRVGDAIALFKGGGSPLIIRSCGEKWKLVGDSYVHGMMNAECFYEENCYTMWLV